MSFEETITVIFILGDVELTDLQALATPDAVWVQTEEPWTLWMDSIYNTQALWTFNQQGSLINLFKDPLTLLWIELRQTPVIKAPAISSSFKNTNCLVR